MFFWNGLIAHIHLQFHTIYQEYFKGFKKFNISGCSNSQKKVHINFSILKAKVRVLQSHCLDSESALITFLNRPNR